MRCHSVDRCDANSLAGDHSESRKGRVNSIRNDTAPGGCHRIKQRKQFASRRPDRKAGNVRRIHETSVVPGRPTPVDQLKE